MKLRNKFFVFFLAINLLFSITSCFGQNSRRANALIQQGQARQLLDPKSQEYLDEIEKVFVQIKQYYIDEVDSKKLYEGAIKGLVDALGDPHSVYWDQETYKAMQKGLLRGDYGGVGLYINKPNPKSLTADSLVTDFYIYVVAPIKGTPGYRAEIHAGDYITHIDGESVAKYDSDMSVKKLSGEVGTEVLVTILRDETITFDVTLKREQIEVPTVESAMMDNGIGYIRIISWSQHTADAVEKALTSFEKANFSKLIIDLRENGGGLLDSAVKISNFFISRGTIVSTKYSKAIESENQVFSANSFETRIDNKIPIVVLIDHGSASASEIFAGAMKDSKRATIVGNTSYGKGSIQIPFALKYEDSVKLTVGQYFTPSGKNIDKIGITPDIEVPEEKFNDEEIVALQKILTEKYIDNYVKDNPTENEAAFNNFLKELKANEINLDARIVKKLVKNKYQRKMDFPPVYDLEFDTTLQKAVEVLSKK